MNESLRKWKLTRQCHPEKQQRLPKYLLPFFFFLWQYGWLPASKPWTFWRRLNIYCTSVHSVQCTTLGEHNVLVLRWVHRCSEEKHTFQSIYGVVWSNVEQMPGEKDLVNRGKKNRPQYGASQFFSKILRTTWNLPPWGVPSSQRKGKTRKMNRKWKNPRETLQRFRSKIHSFSCTTIVRTELLLLFDLMMKSVWKCRFRFPPWFHHCQRRIRLWSVVWAFQSVVWGCIPNEFSFVHQGGNLFKRLHDCFSNFTNRSQTVLIVYLAFWVVWQPLNLH